MKKAYWAVLSVLVFVLLPGRAAFGCRYNVRETGFVDLGIEPYVLCGFVDGNTPADVSAGFKRICDAGLAQSNILFRLIDIDRQKEHAAMKYFDPNSQSAPCAVLVSPDGQTTAVSVAKGGGSFEKSVGSAVGRILGSPVRDKLMQEVAKMYGVILLIEGPDAEANAKAKKGALAAIEQVESQMDFMPKEIAHPPALVVMDFNSVGDEEILLWSLGLEAKDVNEPLAIIVYGKGRWIGPLFRGEQVNEEDLASILFVVGADCECGLDYRWLQGTMLPAKWDRKLHERAVESLGFDPESPMIKMEIGSIIGRGLGGRGYPSSPFGYQELIIESETDFDEPAVRDEVEREGLDGGVAESNDVGAEADEAGSAEEAEAKEVTEKAEEAENVEKAAEAVSATETKAVAEEAEKATEGASAVKTADSAEGGRVGVDPNSISTTLRDKGLGEAEEEDTFGAMRSTALLTIGLFAFVAILGVAILVRARRA